MQIDSIDSRDDGKALVLNLSGADGNVRLTLPAEMLDDECGIAADEASRRAWAQDHLPQIVQAYLARVSGGVVRQPYGRVTVEEID